MACRASIAASALPATAPNDGEAMGAAVEPLRFQHLPEHLIRCKQIYIDEGGGLVRGHGRKASTVSQGLSGITWMALPRGVATPGRHSWGMS